MERNMESEMETGITWDFIGAQGFFRYVGVCIGAPHISGVYPAS